MRREGAEAVREATAEVARCGSARWGRDIGGQGVGFAVEGRGAWEDERRRRVRADVVVERLVCFDDHGYCLGHVVVGAHAACLAEWVGLGEVLEGEGGRKGVGGWLDVEVYGTKRDGRGDNDAFSPGHTSLVAFFDCGIAEAVEDMVPEPQAKACHCVFSKCPIVRRELFCIWLSNCCLFDHSLNTLSKDNFAVNRPGLHPFDYFRSKKSQCESVPRSTAGSLSIHRYSYQRVSVQNIKKRSSFGKPRWNIIAKVQNLLHDAIDQSATLSPQHRDV
ncbi:hypothetical protein IQ07DRAFT_661875 [Pyrenochaeta sp. DS3sAY3a]|nr:hypothetical protein IQ07DRAFT_661875 [Pyrenochaeta sp. DS3sAY3a]